MSSITITIDNQQFHKFDKAGLRYSTTTNDVKVGDKRAYPFTLITKDGNKYTFYSAEMRRGRELSLEFNSIENLTWDFPGELNSKYGASVTSPSVDGARFIVTLGGQEFLNIPSGDVLGMKSSGSPDATKPQTITVEVKNQDPYVDGAGSAESNVVYVFKGATLDEVGPKSEEIRGVIRGIKSSLVIDFDPMLNAHLTEGSSMA